MRNVHAMLLEYPCVKDVAKLQLHSLTNLLELRHTLKLIQILDEEIVEIEARIQAHMQ